MSRTNSDHNYFNTFISVAEDCPAIVATAPPAKKAGRSVAQVHYEMLVQTPYRYRQDDVLFESSAGIRDQADLDEQTKADLRTTFLAKPQACLRASALPKRYGWGVHFDAGGWAAAVPVESEEYRRFTDNQDLDQLKAMRSKRA